MTRRSQHYPRELREQAVRMVAEVSPKYDSQWAAIGAVAQKLGVSTAETVRKWVRQAEVDAGERPGTTSEESAELKRLKRENAELCTSRSSSAIRWASSLVRPGAAPASISARLTHVRNASGCTSSWPATRRIAAIRCPSAAIASNAIRVARPHSSSLYFLGAGMLCILPVIRACTEPGAHQSTDAESKLVGNVACGVIGNHVEPHGEDDLWSDLLYLGLHDHHRHTRDDVSPGPHARTQTNDDLAEITSLIQSFT